MQLETMPMTVIGIIILVAIGISVIVKKFGQNPVLGYILAGFILGPFLLGYLNPEDALVAGFGELGLFILLFYLGLELSLKDFLKAGSASFGLALVDMALSAGLGMLIMFTLGYTLITSIIIGFMLFCTSTAVVAKFAIDRGLLKDPPTQLAISILILQDFLGILLLVFITQMSEAGAGINLALTALVFAVSAFFAIHYLSQRVGNWLIKNGYGHTEVTLYALGVGLLVSTVGVLLGLSSALGAYFAGFALAETPSGEKIKRDVNFMRDFFLVFFFVVFGTTIFYDSAAGAVAIPALQELLLLAGIALLLVLVALASHSIVAAILGPLFGLSKHDSSATAILLLPLGEFVVIIATVSATVLPAAEGSIVSALAFLLIAASVIIFQPLYDRVELHRRAMAHIPEFFKLKRAESGLKQHTPYTVSLLRGFALNVFVLLCFAWMTFLLYEQLPRLGVPIIYSREATAVLAFAFFAALPFTRAVSAAGKLLKHAVHGRVGLA
ncbi:MAG: cation:proton antiporter [Candidatus Diapherotrites archaeon]